MNVEIDIDALDTEWLKQPKLYMEAAEAATELNADLAMEKDVLEGLKAQLSLKIREDPEAFGIGKTTEAIIASAIISQGSYMEQLELVRTVKHKHESAMNKVKALDHRKKALENLVQLYIGQYFSSPREEREEGQESIKKVAERNSERKARTMKRKRK